MAVYVLHVLGGKEEKIVRELTHKKITSIVPKELALIRKSGTWHEQERLLIPGYVFVQCEFNTDVYYIAKAVNGVIRFLGAPTPLTNKDNEFINLFLTDEISKPSEIEIENGHLNAVSGILKGNENRIVCYSKHHKRATIKLDMANETKLISLSANFTDKA